MRDDLNIAIIGAGENSLLAAKAFGKVYPVTVFDPDGSKKNRFEEHGISFTDRTEALEQAGILLLSGSKRPVYTLDALAGMCEIAGKHMRKGAVVIFEAPVYPGTTEETCIPILEQQSGLIAGKEFFIGFAPARWHSGESRHITKMRKVVAGQSGPVTDYLADLFLPIHDGGIFKAKSIRVAEAAQLLEIAQQEVNVALMNEVALTLNQQGIDTYDVLETANTKRGFIKIEPDLLGEDQRFLESARQGFRRTDRKGRRIAQQIVKKLIQNEVVIHESRITILGIAPEEPDIDSPETGVMDLVLELREYGMDVQVSDIKLDAAQAECAGGILLTKQEELLPAIAVVLAVPHAPYRKAGWKLFKQLLEQTDSYVFDVKSVLDRSEKPEKVSLWRM